LANEEGGRLIFGMQDDSPHAVVGTNFAEGKIGELEDEVYSRIAIRVHCKEFFDAEDPEQLKYLIKKKYAGNYLDFDFQIADKIKINEIKEKEDK